MEMELLINEKIMDFISELLLLSSLNNGYYDDMDKSSYYDEIDIVEITSKYLNETNIILGNKFDEEMYLYIDLCKSLINNLTVKNIVSVEMYNIFNKKMLNKIIYDNSIDLLEINDSGSYYENINTINQSIDNYFESLVSKFIDVDRYGLEEILNSLIELSNHVYDISKGLVKWANDRNKFLFNSGKADILSISENGMSVIYFLVRLYVSMFKICSKLFGLFINKIEYQLF